MPPKRASFLAEITAEPADAAVEARSRDFGSFHDERRLSDRGDPEDRRMGEGGVTRGECRATCRRRRSFPKAGSSARPTWSSRLASHSSVPAAAADVYRCFVIPIPIDSNKTVSAVEFRPGNRKVVHHALAFP